VRPRRRESVRTVRALDPLYALFLVFALNLR